MTKERFARLKAYALEQGHTHISLEFCMEIDDMISGEDGNAAFIPGDVLNEFREFMNGMHKMFFG